MIERMLPLSAELEALLFAAGEPLEKALLVELLACSVEELASAVGELEKALSARGLVVLETDAELELRTAPRAAALVQKMREGELSRDLGKASVETLAVIAYQKGVTRSEIDWVRGVNSAAAVRTLLLRGLVVASEDPLDKRRLRYALTPEALAHLGVARAEDLPRYEALKADADTAREAGAAREAAAVPTPDHA